MAKKDQKMFKSDRRKQLRLRLTAKKARGGGQSDTLILPLYEFPERELLNRIIERVRRL